MTKHIDNQIHSDLFCSASKIKGFTLLEMVVTTGIFAVVAVISYGGFVQFIDTRDRVIGAQQQLEQLSRTHSFLRSDLKHLIAHRQKNDDGSRRNPVMFLNQENLLLDFTSLSRNYLLPESGRSQRITYRLEEGSLIRSSYSALDPNEQNQKVNLALLNDVRALSVGPVDFLSVNSLQNDFISGDQTSLAESLDDELDRIPDIVRVNIDLEDGSSYEWLFDLPDSLVANN